jgi:hypothetical protein
MAPPGTDRHVALGVLLSSEFFCSALNSLKRIPTAASLTMLPGLSCFTSRHFAFSSPGVFRAAIGSTVLPADNDLSDATAEFRAIDSSKGNDAKGEAVSKHQFF